MAINEKAIEILKQWAVSGARGQKHPNPPHEPDLPRKKAKRDVVTWDKLPEGLKSIVPPTAALPRQFVKWCLKRAKTKTPAEMAKLLS